MKEILNWRYYIILAMSAGVLLLLGGSPMQEPGWFATFIAAKISGVALLAALLLVSCKWLASGKLPVFSKLYKQTELW